jgi:hypothetical protein
VPLRPGVAQRRGFLRRSVKAWCAVAGDAPHTCPGPGLASTDGVRGWGIASARLEA